MVKGAREGDRVEVFFGMSIRLEGMITYSPCATGDSWVIVEDDGTIHNVQLFEDMKVLSRKSDIANQFPLR